MAGVVRGGYSSLEMPVTIDVSCAEKRKSESGRTLRDMCAAYKLIAPKRKKPSNASGTWKGKGSKLYSPMMLYGKLSRRTGIASSGLSFEIPYSFVSRY